MKHEDGTYLIKSAEMNQDIAVGESVSFGFIANSDFTTFPESYKMNLSTEQVDNSAYSVNYSIINQWNAGCTGKLMIENLSESTLEDWSLEFKCENISSIVFSTVDIIESDNGYYKIHSKVYNQNISAGDTLVLEFNALTNGVAPEFHDFVLSQILLKEKKVKDPAELEDIGEIFFQEVAPEDILLDEESGLYYVRNQLLVSAMIGVDKEFIEYLVESIDASIFGYIELSNDYQIQFNEEKTFEEMQNIIRYLRSFSFISNVSLNTLLVDDEDTTVPDDTEYVNEVWDEQNPAGSNWGLEAICALTAWDSNPDIQEVKIGVIDGMFDENHDDLDFYQVWNNVDASNLNSSHGSHVSGIMSAVFNNATGISGTATKTRLYAYANSGSGDPNTENMTTVMEYKYAFALLIGNQVKVINVSQNTGRLQCFAASHGNAAAIQYVEENANILGDFLNKLLMQGYDFNIVAAGGNVENLSYKLDANATYGYSEWDSSLDPLSSRLSGGALAYYNSYLNAITLPAVKSRIITVGSIKNASIPGDIQYNYSDFSNVGDRIDVVAPGEDIYSCTLHNSYGNLSGTSMAAPYVAGVAGLIYEMNPSLSGSQVKNIIISESTKTVANAYGDTYPLLNAAECVEKANSSFGITVSGSFPTGIIAGVVQGSNGDVLQGANITAYRTSTGDSNLEDYYSTTLTDVNGNYEFILREGMYTLNIYKTGYLPVVIKDVYVTPNETNYMENTILTNWVLNSLFAKAEGSVINAINGEPIGEAEVKFRPGWNNKTGNYVSSILGIEKKATTDTLGKFSVELGIGNYTAEITKDGFITGYFNIVALNSITSEQVLVLTPVLSEQEYRIVLTWGESPTDLDSHLVAKTADEKLFHIFYANPEYMNSENEYIAKLDVDDVTSFGPETVTITVNASDLENCTFKYMVHDFTNRQRTQSNALSLSGAIVHVYQGNDLIRTFHAPADKEGTVWNVFEIKDYQITPINTFSYETIPSDVR